jgi:hypothetical protein
MSNCVVTTRKTLNSNMDADNHSILSYCEIMKDSLLVIHQGDINHTLMSIVSNQYYLSAIDSMVKNHVQEIDDSTTNFVLLLRYRSAQFTANSKTYVSFKVIQ